MDGEVAHRRAVGAVVVDRRAPGRLVPVGEEAGGVGGQVVPVRPEVIVDDVEDDREAAGVGRLDEGLYVLGTAVAGVRRVGQHAVVAPIVAAREVADRHDLDGGDAETHEVVQPIDGGAERARGREAADVQLVEHGLVPGLAAPGLVAPPVRGRVDHLARAVDVLRLEARGGIGHQQAVGQPEAVERAGLGVAHHELVPALGRCRPWAGARGPRSRGRSVHGPEPRGGSGCRYGRPIGRRAAWHGRGSIRSRVFPLEGGVGPPDRRGGLLDGGASPRS